MTVKARVWRNRPDWSLYDPDLPWGAAVPTFDDGDGVTLGSIGLFVTHEDAITAVCQRLARGAVGTP